MTDEQRAAVERWNNTDGFACSAPEECIDALHVLAAGFIAEHPADDGKEVTKEWLVAVGGALEEHPSKVRFLRKDAMSIGLWDVDDGWKAMLFVTDQFQACIVRGIKTRSDVRHLCRALGITLKEPQ